MKYPDGILMIQGQYCPHDDVLMVGDEYALKQLRDALDEMIKTVELDPYREVMVWSNDGEGYRIHIKMQDYPRGNNYTAEEYAHCEGLLQNFKKDELKA